MLFEMGLATTVATTMLYTAYKDSNYYKMKEVKKIFCNTFTQVEIKTKKEGAFYLKDLSGTDNKGIKAVIGISKGFKYKDLEDIQEELENAFRARIAVEKVKYSNLVNMHFIFKDMSKFNFEPVRTKANELYLGRDELGKNVIIDVNKDCHLLVGGSTGCGKSFLLAGALTNLIYNNSDEIEIYISQVMKGEIGLFKDCKPVKFYATTLGEVSLILKRCEKMINDRSSKFSKLGLKNITQYNKYQKKKMKRIYFFIEEISFFMTNDADEEEDANLKNLCWNSINAIVKAGRSCGIHFLSVTQRSTVTNLPSDIKSQMCRVTGKQKSDIDSRNIINTGDAITLENYEFILDGASEVIRFKTAFIDEDFVMLNKYVSEIKLPYYINSKNEEVNAIDDDYINNKPIVVEGVKALPTIEKATKDTDNVTVLKEVAVTKKPKRSRKGVVDLNDISQG